MLALILTVVGIGVAVKVGVSMEDVSRVKRGAASLRGETGE